MLVVIGILISNPPSAHEMSVINSVKRQSERDFRCARGLASQRQVTPKFGMRAGVAVFRKAEAKNQCQLAFVRVSCSARLKKSLQQLATSECCFLQELLRPGVHRSTGEALGRAIAFSKGRREPMVCKPI